MSRMLEVYDQSCLSIPQNKAMEAAREGGRRAREEHIRRTGHAPQVSNEFLRKMEEWVRTYQLEKAERRDEDEKKRRERDPNYDPKDDDFDQPPVREYDIKVDYYKVRDLDATFSTTHSRVQVLNVDQYASEAEVRRAFKKRALLYHPDRLHDKSEDEKMVYERMFKEISLAHEILSDNATRRQYDRDRRDGQKSSATWGGTSNKNEGVNNKKRGGVPDSGK